MFLGEIIFKDLCWIEIENFILIIINKIVS